MPKAKQLDFSIILHFSIIAPSSWTSPIFVQGVCSGAIYWNEFYVFPSLTWAMLSSCLFGKAEVLQQEHMVTPAPWTQSHMVMRLFMIFVHADPKAAWLLPAQALPLSQCSIQGLRVLEWAACLAFAGRLPPVLTPSFVAFRRTQGCSWDFWVLKSVKRMSCAGIL